MLQFINILHKKCVLILFNMLYKNSEQMFANVDKMWYTLTYKYTICGEIMVKLTEKEQKTLDYIVKVIVDNGYSPSVRDIKDAIGYKSTSTVYTCLNKLEIAGYIQKENGKSRTIRVDGALLGTRVPLIGRVTAGTPILAIENYDGYVDFIANSIGCDQKNLFALRVNGVSMIEAGIMDGDVVIVNGQNYADNGDIVVAMIDEEATIKTFYRENGRYRLQPENKDLDPIYTEKLVILGRVVASMRTY